MALQEIYYLQRDYQKKNGHWASNLSELELVTPVSPGLDGQKAALQLLELTLTAEGFTATAQVRGKELVRGGAKQVWHIRQDARVWKEPW
jgi:hypothetical protein